MNRAERRKLPRALRDMDYRCPDCDNDTRIRQDNCGMWHLDVLHDDTCPWFTAYRKAHP